jgi:hypothetical protein
VQAFSEDFQLPRRAIDATLPGPALFVQESALAELPSMALNPLAPVTDYQSMLNRIFWFTTAFAVIAVWVLRRYVPELDAQLRQVDFSLQFGGEKVLPIPGGYLLPAMAMGLITRVYRLHARVSDWLGIRECFDIEVIIAELAGRLGIDLSCVSEEQVKECRHRIMRNAFYAFANPSRPQIDSQLILQALDAWSWFWIGVETTLLFTLTGFGLIAASQYQIGIEIITGTLASAALALPLMRTQCQRYAVAQVRAIVSDSARAAVARSAFDELNGVRHPARRAA